MDNKYICIKKNKTKIIGLTGGIGTGKSTVSSILRNLGALIIDADEIARDLLKKYEDVYFKVVEYFGNSILDNEANIDRSKLAQIVFNDKEELMKLNEITHRFVTDKILGIINENLEKCNYKVLVVDAPIPVDSIFGKITDEIWLVESDYEVRLDRVMKRNICSKADVDKRINGQSSIDYKKGSDRIITNNDDLENLKEKVEREYKNFIGEN